MAAEKGFTVDTAGFNACMQDQKVRSREVARAKRYAFIIVIYAANNSDEIQLRNLI